MFGVLVDLVGKLLGDGADCEGVLHVAVVGVGGGHEVGVVVHRVVMMYGVAQVVSELGEEAGGYEGRGSGVYAWFALSQGEVSQCTAVAKGRVCRPWVGL